MLLPQDVGVSVVVRDNEIGSPVNDDRKPRSKANAERATQALRLSCWCSQGRARPVKGLHELGHFAAAGRPAGRRGLYFGIGRCPSGPQPPAPVVKCLPGFSTNPTNAKASTRFHLQAGVGSGSADAAAFRDAKGDNS
jgi:hypothetical protein